MVVESFGKELQLSVVSRGAGFGLLPASQLKTISGKWKIKALAVPGLDLTVSTWFIRKPHMGRLSKPLVEMEASLASLLNI